MIEDQANLDTFRDCLCAPILRQDVSSNSKSPTKKPRRGRKHADKSTQSAGHKTEPKVNDAEELADFVDYLAKEIFTSLPSDLRTLSYSTIQSNPRVSQKYTEPLDSTIAEYILATVPPSVADSLDAYALLPPSASLSKLLTPILTSYITAVTAPPPIWVTTRSSACEICERDWIPLTYHHLIPKQMHAKAIKRGWHEEWQLNRVAWLCRACHSCVHGIASNEELAKDWYSVERLMSREDIQAFAKWVGKVRWKAR